MAKEKVRVRISSEIIQHDFEEGGREEKEKIEFATEGVLSGKGNLLTLVYAESKEMGMSGVETTLILNTSDRGRVTMVRRGLNPTSMIFDLRNRRHICSYRTGGVPLEFCICTKDVVNTVSPGVGGEIRLRYDIEMHGFVAQKNSFCLSLSPLPQKGDAR